MDSIHTPHLERDRLLQQAQDLRLAARLPEALATLERLERDFPRFSRLHEERGQCFLELRNVSAAVGTFIQAVNLNPTLPNSWHALEQLFRHAGDAAAAATAAERLAMLGQLPAEVVQASSLMADGDLDPAAGILRHYLDRDPHNVGVQRLLARICLDQGNWPEAEHRLQRVLQLAADFAPARLDYGLVLLQQQKHRQARDQAKHLLNVDPTNREYRKLYGAACLGLGDYAPVVDLYSGLLAEIPATGREAAELRLWRGNALKTIGRTEDAVADYRAAIRAHPDAAVAWYSLANLKVHRFSPSDVAEMRDAEACSKTPPMDRVYLCFALGKALEDAGDYAAAWSYYARGNALKRTHCAYRPEDLDRTCHQQQEIGTAAFFQTRSGWGSNYDSPIFIVGMPRSGSTLVEQILASHSAIEGTSELAELGQYATELTSLGDLNPESARQLGRRYLEETQIYRTMGRPYFIDKMPNNFLHVGLIQLILPQAKIIDVRREPMACCFGNLKQLFGSNNQPFTYDVQEVTHYTRCYLKLMRHWDSVLPGRVLRVHYEDLIDDLEGSVRRILQYCGLPFEPGCLSFYQTPRSVRTASSQQVREPLSRDSLDHWRHFEQWLAPLKDALGDARFSYRE